MLHSLGGIVHEKNVGVLFATLFFAVFFQETASACSVPLPVKDGSEFSSSDSVISQYLDFEPSLVLTSNYVWRGISQTDNQPAIQGNFKFNSKLGLYIGLWGSNVSFRGVDNKPVTSEFQTYVGYSDTVDKLIYDVGVMRYFYPNADGPNFNEGYFYLGYGIFKVGVARSDNVAIVGGNGTYHGTYYSAEINYNLPPHVFFNISGVSFGAHIGRYLFSEVNPIDMDYTDYRISINKKFQAVSLGLAWTDTDGTANVGALGTAKIVATLSVDFG